MTKILTKLHNDHVERVKRIAEKARERQNAAAALALQAEKEYLAKMALAQEAQLARQMEFNQKMEEERARLHNMMAAHYQDLDETDEIKRIRRNGSNRANGPKIELIQRVICRECDISLTEMISHRRTKDISFFRQVAIYLSKKLTTRSLPEIGRRFGGRDHTTVLHAVRKIEAECQAHDSIRQAVERLERKIMTDFQAAYNFIEVPKNVVECVTNC